MSHITEKEKQSKINTCKICLLAEIMKDCKKCNFQVGLQYKKEESTINKYLVLDNDFPQRKTIVNANDDNEAMSKGASELKTCNIRIYIQKES